MKNFKNNEVLLLTNNKIYDIIYTSIKERERNEIMFGVSREVVENLRKRYPEGTRVELIWMEDPYTNLEEGSKGTVRFIDDIGTVHVNWDCGSSLGLVYGEDSWRVC